MRRAFLIPSTVIASVALGACTVHQDDVPRIVGPSGFAVSIDVTATPDHVRQDGESQSAVVVSARDANGQPIAAMAMRFDISVNGTMQDFGTLSARNAVTGNDGRATVLYTAPASVAGASGPGATIDIVATPVGSNVQTSQSQSVSINLVPPGVILPPAGSPTPLFEVSPTPVNAAAPTRFDASSSLAGTNSTQLAYNWSFGDGATASGSLVTHTFSSAGTFTVTLTVTNDRGIPVSLTKAISVVAASIPTANFVFSPSAPSPLTIVVFNGQLSTAASGRTITQYLWNWGDGETAAGALQDHDFAAVGTYNVVLTVVDDLGQRGTKSLPVTVAVEPPKAEFVFTPTAPARNQTVQFNGGLSKAAAGRAIRGHQWDWGDGSKTAPVASELGSHAFAADGRYVVVLTVTDDLGNRGASSQTVGVGAADP